MEASEIGFLELEGRAISYGNAFDVLCTGDSDDEPSPDITHPVFDSVAFDEFKEDDLNEWILDEDYQCVDDISKMRMTPFIWSPKITYFKRTEGDRYFVEDKMRSGGCKTYQ